MPSSSSWLTRALRVLAVVVVGVLGLLVLPAAAHASTSSDFVSRINSERAARGAPSLEVRGDLAAAAQAQAQRMANRSELFHNPNLGGSVSHWSMLAENVGYGPDVATIHAAFMASASHRTNILNRKYTEVGVGVVVRGHVMWVAEVFRKPTGTTSSSGATGHSGGSGTADKATKPATEPAAHPAAPTHAGADRAPAHRSKTSRPASTPVTAQAPPAHAVQVASAADRALPATVVGGPRAMAYVPAAVEPSDQRLPTTVFVGLGVLAVVLVGAAARVRLV